MFGKLFSGRIIRFPCCISDAQGQAAIQLEMIVSGDRAAPRWVYRTLRKGQLWPPRGVDVFTVRDGNWQRSSPMLKDEIL
jgi:hypothetical protein